MALSPAERQARHRAKAFGEGGTKRRLLADIPADTGIKLNRLASHYGCSVTAVIVRLVDDAVMREQPRRTRRKG